MTAFRQSYDAVARLVDVFEDVMRGRKALEFDEESTRISLINPFWRALGWDVEDPREVVHEKRVATRKGTKRADYCFNVRGRPAFVVEAKEAGKKLTDPDAVFQAKRYGYNLPVNFAVLTDFEEFRLFDSGLEPVYENPARGLIEEFDLTYDRYLDEWKNVYETFSREAVYGGALDKLLPVSRRKRNKEALDRKFFERLTAWREELARVIALDNGDVGVHDLNEAVQRILDRIIFVRVIEDREIEPVELLQDAVNRWAREKEKPLYQYVVDVFRRVDPQYNGELFDRHFSEQLLVRDKPLSDFIESLYYPLCPYQFNVIGVEMLGTIYERFLGSTIRLTPTHRAKVEEKPEVRKAGGVYYTPAYIVDYIVENTVGKLLDVCKTPRDVAKLKILDPACGSGSFLLGAFRRLIEWHEDYYNAHPEKIAKPPKSECWLDKEHPDGPRHRLTARAKGRILVNNIYGVDIDPSAVEVTVMSLYLKVLEDVDAGLLMKTALLPPLDGNVKCGNSLIGSDYWDFIRAEQGELFERTEAEDRRVNPFDWDQEFPEVIKYKPGTRDLADGYGFDVVIGNPPYVRSRNIIKGDKIYFSDIYNVSARLLDTYYLFIEKGITLLRDTGRFSMIVPNGILTNYDSLKVRKYLLDKCRLEVVVDLKSKVFSAGVDTSIIVAKKDSNITRRLNNVISIGECGGKDIKAVITPKNKISQNCIYGIESYPFNTALKANEVELIVKIKGKNTEIRYLGEMRNGMKIRKELLYKKEVKDSSKFLLGRSIKPYYVDWQGYWVVYNKKLEGEFSSQAFREERIFLSIPKLLIRQVMAERIYVSLDNIGYYVDQTIYIFIPYEHTELDIRYILAVLSSNLLGFYFKRTFSDVKETFPKIKSYQIERLPVRPIDFSDPADVEKHDRMVRLVDEMLDLHKRLSGAKSDADLTRLERAIKTTDRRIDALVYELYGLTEEEVRVVEG
jgi:adenine-specific DNA-methyltransferase